MNDETKGELELDISSAEGFYQRYEYSDTPYSFVVPGDTQRVFLSLGGGYGGFGSDDPRTASGAAGNGARIWGLVPVVPGETLTITVGAVASGRNAGRGYRPGGAGGDGSTDQGRNGGGGGGSSAIVGSKSGLVMEAGGGGGSGGAGLGGDGGNGGYGGIDPANGKPGEGGARGGQGGDPSLTENGGNGTDGSFADGGGGGGGGGLRCGRGGGAGSSGNGGGGGGGGASFHISTALGVGAGTTENISSDETKKGYGYVTILSEENLFKIVSVIDTAKVMAVASNSNEQTTPLIQYPYGGDNSQQWKIVWINKNGSLCQIVSLLSGLVVAVAAGQYVGDNQRIIQYPYTGDPSQQWKLVKIDGESGNRYKIVSVASGQVVAVAGNQPNPSPLIQYPYSGDPSQQWELVPLSF